MSHQTTKRLGNSENMLVLERFQQKSAMLAVTYPSIWMEDALPESEMPVFVQIVGTLKVHKDRGIVVIDAGETCDNSIQFNLTPDLNLYLDPPDEGVPGQNLTIVGKNFSIDICEIAPEDEGDEEDNTTTAA